MSNHFVCAECNCPLDNGTIEDGRCICDHCLKAEQENDDGF